MRNGRVYFADGNAYFNRPGPRLADSAEMLAEMLHPEVAGTKHEGTAWVRMCVSDPVVSDGRRQEFKPVRRLVTDPHQSRRHAASAP